MGSVDLEFPEYDTLVIGAGLSGCYACHRMREQNLKVRVLEAGTSVGGTWYWSKTLDPFSERSSMCIISDAVSQIDTREQDSIRNHTHMLSSFPTNC